MIRAAEQFQKQRGDYFAAGTTYYTVLALFPLLMIGFAVAGFVLARNPDLLADAQEKITEAAPGDMSKTLNDLINQAIDSRSAVGVIGLLGALYAGLGWMANLRAALTEQWEQEPPETNFVKTKVADLIALFSLFLALIVSLGISALGSGPVGRKILEILYLDEVPGAGLVLKVSTIAVGIVASWALFTWIIARLPRLPVTLKSAARAGLLAAVVFEVFKQVATIYLQSVLKSPAGATFGPIIGIMVFAFFFYRIVLFATAWAATSRDNLALLPVQPPKDPVVISPRVDVHRGPGIVGGFALFGAGVFAALRLTRRNK